MISVVIPVYNVEKYIEYCLKSLENQTYKEFEVIIVNDGSTDMSLERISNYLIESNLNAKVITQKNSGVSVARNSGIIYALGEYISFIDSDDILHPRYFEELLNNIVELDADMAICEKKDLSEGTIKYEDEISASNVSVYSKKAALECMLYGKFKVGIWSALCKREVLGETKFAEEVSYGEDLEVLWKLVSKSQKVIYNSAPLYGYRIRESSAMAKMSPKRLTGMKLFENLEQYFEENVPEFAAQYKQYGVARWVWGTMWQAAVATRNYRDFRESTKNFLPSKNMRKLFKYPDIRVKLSSVIYSISPFLYFAVLRMIRHKLRSIS